jgi:hypothetical protein
MSVLAAACSSVEPPPPTGTIAVPIRVRNLSDAPLGELGVKVPKGMLAGAAQPPWVPAGATTVVTFYVPPNGEWWVALNGIGVFVGDRRPGGDPRCFIEFAINRVPRENCP